MKRIFGLFLLMCVVLLANAAPAKRGISKEITLTDGTTVTAQLVGDEHGHFWMANGKAYQAVENTDVFQAVNLNEVVRTAQMRRTQSNARRAKKLAPKRIGEFNKSYLGQKKGIVILVNFSDVNFEADHDSLLFTRFANEVNFSDGRFQGSMHDYFYAQSEGQFELTFDVVGPVTVSQKQSYYGGNNSQGNDKRPAEMVIEALKLADKWVNYADYDWDGDGEVDQVYVVYAGQGEADGGASSTIWPHEWSLSAAGYYGEGSGAQWIDGVKIDTYACGPELNGSGIIEGIGTMCHEFSHCLGYPDFYDTDYSGGQGMGYWDLMDGGCYNGDGCLPAGYTSYERWVAGWKTPIELTKTQKITDMKALSDGGDAYIIYNPGNRNEYFLLENRQHIGWDGDLPGTGLLIIHVDYNESIWGSNQPNDDPSHQRMTWMPADDKYQKTIYNGSTYYTWEGMANDTYPYGSNNSFSRTSSPAASLYNKNTDGTYYLNTSVEQITKKNNLISFIFRGESNVKTPVFSVPAGRYLDAQTVSISCETEGAAIYYTVDGTEPSAESTAYTEPVTITETTTLKAVAIVNDEESAIASAKYTIGESISNPNVKTFAPVESVDDMEPGMRYIIACEAKKKAAGAINKTLLTAVNVTEDDNNMLTIGNDAAVFVLNGDQTNGWSLKNEKTGRYLYATEAKKLAYGDQEKAWTVEKGTEGLIISYQSYGTMLYNSNSPRFTTYTADPTAAILEAYLYMEYDDGTTPRPVAVTAPVIGGETPFENSTTVTITAEEGAIIYYTLDGSIPTTESLTYTEPFSLDATVTVMAIAVVDGNVSEVTTMTFTTSSGKPVDENAYELVTDAATLANGNKILWVCTANEATWAIGTTQGTNNRPATTVTLNADGTVTPSEETQVITLEKSGDLFRFNVGDGYLYAASNSKNALKTTPTADDNATAAIEINGGEATITFQGSYERNTVRFNPNNGSPIFSCYAPNSSTGSLPQIYRQKSGMTSINELSSDASAEALYYDLAGRSYRELPARRGLYIRNGRKFIVK